MFTRRTWIIAAIFVVAVAVFAALIGLGAASTSDGFDLGGRKLILGPVEWSNGQMQLERQSRGVPWLRISLRGRGLTDSDLELILDAWTRVLQRNKPFVIIWDARKLKLAMISRAQLRMLQAWFRDHFLTWDTLLQAHITIIGNPLARAFASVVTRVFRPPQPIHHASSESDAEEYAARCCSTTRSYMKSKAEYAAAPGWKHFGI
jgi:hypothetical protein